MTNPTTKSIYADGKKSVATWLFFLFSLAVFILMIILMPHFWTNYQADLAKTGQTTFDLIFYSIIYFLVIAVFLVAFAAFCYGFLYAFCRKIILTDKTIIFQAVFKKAEINLQDITHFAIGKIDLPIVYSTGYGPMGSVSGWDYPSIYYKKKGKSARLVLPWFKLGVFIVELNNKAPWIKIKIPQKYLNQPESTSKVE